MESVITFNGRGCEEWGLKLKAFKVPMPKPKTNYVNIPGANGSLDMTEIFGGVLYDDRNVQYVFDYIGSYEDWEATLSDFANYLHGQKQKVIIAHDAGYYYEGRLSVEPSKTNHVTGEITVAGRMAAYKMERFSSMEDWEWDTFNFETGIIREYKDLVVDGERTLVVPGNRKEIIPSFICSTPMEVVFDGKTYPLPAGTSKVINIVIAEGENVLTFMGSGTVSVDYRGGSL